MATPGTNGVPLSLLSNPQDYQRYMRYLQTGGDVPFKDWAMSGSPATQWYEMLAKRNAAPPNSPQQIPLANLEHAAWAREAVRDNPFIGIPQMLLEIPGYTASKALGIRQGRTPASIREMAAGYQGMWEGLADYLTK